jgi:hypothetical protein
MFEKIFKKKVDDNAQINKGKQIEGLVDRLKKEKLDFENNQSYLKSELESIGGMDVLIEEIYKRKKEQDKWAGITLLNFSCLVVLTCCAHHEGHTHEAESLITFVQALNATVTAFSVGEVVREWWSVKDMKDLKEGAGYPGR